jgi:ribosome biogenesis GTPase
MTSEVMAEAQSIGEVVKLDRGFPLVAADGRLYRCKHATALVKGEDQRAVIGDKVVVASSEGQDIAQIREILPRRTQLVRRDPAERTVSQVMAANFDIVVIAQPIVDLNLPRLERELVLAYETGAEIAIVLTKADLAESAQTVEALHDTVAGMAGSVPVFLIAPDDPQGVQAFRAYLGDRTAVLVGKSGVGKSSLVNLLVGSEVQATTPVREVDGKGRHTTVSREIVEIPGGGRVVDMPGVRGLGLWDARRGIAAAFADVEDLAQQCRFRDCAHKDEPGCAVREAVESGALASARMDAYLHLLDEYETNLKRREVAQRKRERRGHPRRRRGDI